MGANSQFRVDSATLSEVAAAYRRIQTEISELEKDLQGYRDILERAALQSPLLTLDLAHFRITVTPSEREVFALKEAREQIGDQVLRPFMRLSKYNRLKVAEKAA